jgi:predicted amidohydrolase
MRSAVAVCQLAIEDPSVAENRGRVRERVAGLADGVDLAVCPEYALTGFTADEREVLTPGEDLVTVGTPLGTAGLSTCYDLNSVEESATLAREEVTALLV